jgi:hypothetical protein
MYVDNLERLRPRQILDNDELPCPGSVAHMIDKRGDYPTSATTFLLRGRLGQLGSRGRVQCCNVDGAQAMRAAQRRSHPCDGTELGKFPTRCFSHSILLYPLCLVGIITVITDDLRKGGT